MKIGLKFAGDGTTLDEIVMLSRGAEAAGFVPHFRDLIALGAKAI